LRYLIYLSSEKILSLRRWVLNRLRLNRDRRGGVRKGDEKGQLVETLGEQAGVGRVGDQEKERGSYIFDTRYLLHSYSGSPFMEPYFTRNWAPTVHCVDHNGRII